MELHTIGSGGGYTEADVTAFAKILTGWSYVRGWEADGGFERRHPAKSRPLHLSAPTGTSPARSR